MSGFFKRFFGRGYARRHGDGSIYGQWSSGDHAVCISESGGWLCVETGEPFPDEFAPEKGGVYTVVGVRLRDGWHGLQFADLCGWFIANNFRKVVLDAHEAADPEFVTLLKRAKVRA